MKSKQQLNNVGIYLRLSKDDEKAGESPYWGAFSILQILRNPAYIGNLVQMKHTTTSYKNHKIILKDESDWVVIENAHEAIIDRELWDKCQERKKPYRRGRSTKRSGTDPLSGLVFCPDCRSTIRLCWNTTHKGKDRVKFKYRHFSIAELIRERANLRAKVIT